MTKSEVEDMMLKRRNVMLLFQNDLRKSKLSAGEKKTGLQSVEPVFQHLIAYW